MHAVFPKIKWSVAREQSNELKCKIKQYLLSDRYLKCSNFLNHIKSEIAKYCFYDTRFQLDYICL